MAGRGNPGPASYGWYWRPDGTRLNARKYIAGTRTMSPNIRFDRARRLRRGERDQRLQRARGDSQLIVNQSRACTK